MSDACSSSRVRADCIPPPPRVPRECTDADLIERVMIIAFMRARRRTPRWKSVARVFNITPEKACALCVRFGYDPENRA